MPRTVLTSEESAMSRLMIVVVTLLLSLGTARAACTDAAAVAATRAAADALCPCGTFRSHKAYIHCVAQVAKAAVLSGDLPKAFRAAVLGCAKKSTCGKAGFVTCCRTTSPGNSSSRSSALPWFHIRNPRVFPAARCATTSRA
jgi:hypothetical protein